MKSGILGLLFAWFVAILFYFLSIFMKKKYLKMKENYESDLVKNGEDNFKKNYLDLFKLYVTILSVCKWFLFIYGILILLREVFAKHFD